MAEVVIDGSEIVQEADLHRKLTAQLDFGDYYGHNLAALRDRLLSDVTRPVHIVWLHAEVSRRQISDELFHRITEVFEEAAAQDAQFNWDDRFTFELR